MLHRGPLSRSYPFDSRDFAPPAAAANQAAEQKPQPHQQDARARRKRLTAIARGVEARPSRLRAGRQPATPSDGASAVPAGEGSSPLLPGGIGHHVDRHYDRSARCSL
jgi:hypothetical protein